MLRYSVYNTTLTTHTHTHTLGWPRPHLLTQSHKESEAAGGEVKTFWVKGIKNNLKPAGGGGCTLPPLLQLHPNGNTDITFYQ